VKWSPCGTAKWGKTPTVFGVGRPVGRPIFPVELEFGGLKPVSEVKLRRNGEPQSFEDGCNRGCGCGPGDAHDIRSSDRRYRIFGVTGLSGLCMMAAVK